MQCLILVIKFRSISTSESLELQQLINEAGVNTKAKQKTKTRQLAGFNKLL